MAACGTLATLPRSASSWMRRISRRGGDPRACLVEVPGQHGAADASPFALHFPPCQALPARRNRALIWVLLANPSIARNLLPPSIRWWHRQTSSGHRDGVHRGHLAVIKRATMLALNLAALAWFYLRPHPPIISRVPTRSSPYAARPRARALEQLGIDGMIVINSTRF
jgi:hypothetical protein